jgi:hypothetical protein
VIVERGFTRRRARCRASRCRRRARYLVADISRRLRDISRRLREEEHEEVDEGGKQGDAATA